MLECEARERGSNFGCIASDLCFTCGEVMLKDVCVSRILRFAFSMVGGWESWETEIINGERCSGWRGNGDTGVCLFAIS